MLREVETCLSPGDFVEVQVVKEKNSGGNNDDSRNGDEIGEEEQLETSSELFSCPGQGFTLSFKRHPNLKNHICYGRRRLCKENLTVLDQAKVLNKNQGSYLEEKFLIGQSTGINADPSQVARDLQNARTESGKRRFSIHEFLTPQQIESYFYKAAKTKEVVADEEATELAQNYHQTYSLARETIVRECQIEHPIMCDTFDVCKLYSEGKLTKLNVALLRRFCIFFSMDVDGLY